VLIVCQQLYMLWKYDHLFRWECLKHGDAWLVVSSEQRFLAIGIFKFFRKAIKHCTLPFKVTFGCSLNLLKRNRNGDVTTIFNLTSLSNGSCAPHSRTFIYFLFTAIKPAFIYSLCFYLAYVFYWFFLKIFWIDFDNHKLRLMYF